MKNGKILLAVVAAGMAASAAAAVRGAVTTANGRQEGMVAWSQASRKYTVTQTIAGGGTRSMEVKEAEAVKVEIEKPAQLDAAIKGRNKTALAGIVKTYSHLQWDLPAAAVLADIHLSGKATAEALKVCKDVIAKSPDAAWKGDLAPVYWRALLENNDRAELDRQLAKALKSGDRFSSASALIVRGDMVLRQGATRENARKALLDGYLRVILLYTEDDVVSRLGGVQYEKAARCFELMGYASRAAELRAKAR